MNWKIIRRICLIRYPILLAQLIFAFSGRGTLSIILFPFWLALFTLSLVAGIKEGMGKALLIPHIVFWFFFLAIFVFA